MDPLAQLHGDLEPQTARCMQDISTDIEFDASLVSYVATANSLRGIGAPLLSRFEIFVIGPPGPHEAVQVARHVIDSGLRRLGLQERVRFERRCAYVLAHMSPRLMQRSVELLAAAALRDEAGVVREDDALRALGWGEDGPRLH
jgi:ATP-dependent Lon protease